MSPETTVNPELITLTRADRVESRHRGAVCVMAGDGRTVAAIGDVERWVFPRSAVKIIQALPLVETGAADAFGLTPADLAIACASHVGSAAHVTRASGMLARLDLEPGALACGAHMPADADEQNRLVREGRAPTRAHNNCSGKHAGMVLAARQLGAPTEGYEHFEHPLQVAIREHLEALSDQSLSDVLPGIDGCGLPNWPLPVRALALAFARIADPASTSHGPAFERLMAACWAHPQMPGGVGKLDTEILAAASGRIYVKTGAEGVYVAALPKAGLGVALKIDDGATRASELAVLTLLGAIEPALAPLVEQRCLLRNWAGEVVGRAGPTPELAEAAAALAEAVRSRG